MISFVVPAYNEAALLGETLDTLRASAAPLGEPFEIIVADDGSTDETAAIARGHGALVVTIHVRQIGAARNAGARVATGDVLIFVDADTLVPPEVLVRAAAALRTGAVGGGAGVRADSNDPRWGPPAMAVVSWILRLAGWAAGCFIFVRRDVFERVGGFDERYFASEEIHLSRAVKKHGRFVILRERVITSGRKGRMFSAFQTFRQFASAIRPSTLRRRDRLGMWYGGQREKK